MLNYQSDTLGPVASAIGILCKILPLGPDIGRCHRTSGTSVPAAEHTAFAAGTVPAAWPAGAAGSIPQRRSIYKIAFLERAVHARWSKLNCEHYQAY